MWSLSLITAPAAEALDISPGGEVYQHLRLEPALTPQDALIAAFAAAARQEGERISRRQFITATWELWMDSFWERGIFDSSVPWCRSGALLLPTPPLQSVTSVKYQDGSGVEQTWDAAKYTVEAPQGDFPARGRIYPKSGESWPTAASPQGSVKIRFVAGYGAAPANVPALFRGAMLLIVGESYERREEATIGTIQSKNVRSAERIFFDNRAW